MKSQKYKETQRLVHHLNNLTGNPTHPLIDVKDENITGGGCYNIPTEPSCNPDLRIGNGCYHIKNMGNTYKLAQVIEEKGSTGTRDISNGYMSISNLNNWIWAFYKGIKIGKTIRIK
jgi:hypothetical protein